MCVGGGGVRFYFKTAVVNEPHFLEKRPRCYGDVFISMLRKSPVVPLYRMCIGHYQASEVAGVTVVSQFYKPVTSE